MDDKVIGLAVVAGLAYLVYSQGQAAARLAESTPTMPSEAALQGDLVPPAATSGGVPRYYNPTEPLSYYAQSGYGQSARLLQGAHQFADWVRNIQLGYPQRIGVINVGGGGAAGGEGEWPTPNPMRVR